ncbi:MAG TPA: PPC domain-containing protein, partial [Pirellulales bacterium]|nr:PPC domain-containing protein [Pirellulales bacterium]
MSADPNSFANTEDRVGPDVYGNEITNNSINAFFIRIRTNAGEPIDVLGLPARITHTDVVYVLAENLFITGNPGGPSFLPTADDALDTEWDPRVAGSLVVDPGVIMKLSGARIQTQVGGSQFVAEGTAANPVIFTSLADDSYGAGGTFDTNADGSQTSPNPGDWGGMFFNADSSASIDHAVIQYAGGQTTINGGFAHFNAVEIQQANVRIANSVFQNNAGGDSSGDADPFRNGLQNNATSNGIGATIFVRGAQPVIVNNVIQDNQGAAISVDDQSFSTALIPDWGRSTTPPGGYGSINTDLSAVPAGIGGPDVFRYGQFDKNDGPLVRLNRLDNNLINGMVVRGGSTLESASIWDDTDIVHVLEGTITVPNFASVGGLRLQSSPTQSLVVKVTPNSGFVASGTPLDIADRIGGEIQILGTSNHPVVLTSYRDDSVGAGLTPTDQPNNETVPDKDDTQTVAGTVVASNSIGGPSDGGAKPGDWGTTDPNAPNSPGGGIIFDQYSNDRNVAMVNQTSAGPTPATAQSLGQLAANQQGGDDNLRLGFQVNGFMGPQEVDTYTFKATAGTQVWINVTNTSSALDAVLELVDANGNVLARSDNSGAEQRDATAAGDPLLAGPLLQSLLPNNLAQPLQGGAYTQATGGQTQGMNFWSTNPYDPGFRVTLPGTAGAANNYYVRVYAKGQTPATAFVPGNGSAGGQYELQVRLQQQVEVPGSTVQNADIRYATTGIDVEGLPAHSPLISNATATGANVGSLGSAQNLGNLLASDTNSIGVSGNLATPQTVQWYQFQLTYQEIQVITSGSGGAKTWSTIFDIGYADGLTRPDTEIDVYDSSGNLIYVGGDSNIADQQPQPNEGQDASNLSHSSFGTLDPYIGPVQMEAGVPKSGTFTYFVAIHSNATLPQALDGVLNPNSSNFLVRFEPVDSINRVVEDHVGTEGGQTGENVQNLTPLWGSTPGGAAGFTAPTGTVAQLNTYAAPFNLSDVVLYVGTGGNFAQTELETINPFTGVQETDQGTIKNGGTNLSFNTFAMRNDGQLYGLTFGNAGQGTTDATSGQYTQIDTGTAAGNVLGSDNIGTFDFNNASPPAVQNQNVGIQMNAMAFVESNVPNGTSTNNVDQSRALYAVGSYVGGHFSPAFTNGLYRLNPDTGAVLQKPTPGWINVTLQNAAPPTQPQPVIVFFNGKELAEKLTGMAFVNGQMFAVGDLGNLYTLDLSTINIGAGTVNAALVANIGNFALQGLTAGPPDVESGKYAKDLFSTENGRLIAFDTTGVQQHIFPGNSSTVFLGVGGVESLAFSTLDYNLWHVTNNRKLDTGHGINMAPDQSRNTLSPNKPPPNAGESYYFGLEDPANQNTLSPQPGAANYITNTAIAQGWQNEASGGTYTPDYNVPGGAYGVLTTNSFSLANYTATDKPTVYFNYYLNTEDAQSQSSNKLKTMFDSARLEVSEDGGQTWNLLASNNPFRATFPQAEAEQPYYQSLNAETGSVDSKLSPFGQPLNNGFGLQGVQPLFDSTTTNTGWRQARVDLTDYAGQNNLQFRFDFSTAGTTFNPSDLAINAVTGKANPYANANVYGNQFGQFQGPQGSPVGSGPEHRGLNNNHEGWYIDDVVVGFAGRGEMVTAPGGGGSGYVPAPVNPDPAAPQVVQSGPYQLEIRRGPEVAVNVNNLKPDIALLQSFDVHARFADAYSLIATAGSGLTVGQTFTLNDGVHSVTFEFVNNAGQLTNPTFVPIVFATTDTAQQVGDAIVAAINSNPTLVKVSASDQPNGTVAGGIQGVSDPRTNIVNLFGVVEVLTSTATFNRLTVSASGPTSITESGATNSTTMTVTREGDASNPLTVSLTALDVDSGFTQPSTNVALPPSVTFLAGQSSTTFTVTGVKKLLPAGIAALFPDNEQADGTQTIEIVAKSAGLSSVGGTIDVTDDPGVYPKLAVTLASSLSVQDSAAPIAGTVTINTGPLDPNVYPNGLVVNLQSLDPGAATVSPATFTIPADGTTTSFPITVTAADDGVTGHPGGLQDPVILATAAGFVSGSAMLGVVDDDAKPPLANTALIVPPPQTPPSTNNTGGELPTNTYYYKVTATSAAGETTPSNEQSIGVTGPTGEVTVNWTADPGATGYKIYRGTAAGGENVLVGIVGAVTTYTDTQPESLDRTFGQTSWVAEGPAPMTGGQSQTADNLDEAAGAIETVLPGPTNALTGLETAYVGAVNGGIWATTNYDPNPTHTTPPAWTPLTDNLPPVSVNGNLREPSNSIGALQFAVDATNPAAPKTENSTLIAGIGRFSSFAFAGGFLSGLIRSTDGGTTWTDISPANLQGLNISGVAERDNSTTGTTTLLAGANGFVSSAGGLYIATVPTVSLVNAAHVVTPTFTSVLEPGGLPFGNVTDLVSDPGDPNRFYVASLDNLTGASN